VPDAESSEQPTSIDNDAPGPPSICTADVFRALIEDELRNGRLTPTRRRRIVRYAMAMGLTATQAGDLIAECRHKGLEHADPQIRQHALRLVYPDPPMIPAGIKLAFAAIVAILLDLVLVAVVMS